jgi:BolA family transcriptional regulator, general stress-responsive regulator
MQMQRRVEERLLAELAPDFLEVVNESSQHSVPRGSETHFKVVVVSAAFAGKRSVQRHQQVYAVLAEQLANGIHALALHTYTPEEWLLRQQSAPPSPECLGGSKRDH